MKSQETNGCPTTVEPLGNEDCTSSASPLFEKVCNLIGVKSPESISIIRWLEPQIAPAEASYVLIKTYDSEFGYVCSAATYENGAFWDISANNNHPIDSAEIVAWSYLPCDDRIDALGDIKP